MILSISFCAMELNNSQGEQTNIWGKTKWLNTTSIFLFGLMYRSPQTLFNHIVKNVLIGWKCPKVLWKNTTLLVMKSLQSELTLLWLVQVSLGVLAGLPKLPAETLTWLASSDGTDFQGLVPGMDGAYDPIPFVSVVVTMFLSITGVNFTHEIAHRCVSLSNPVSMLLPKYCLGYPKPYFFCCTWGSLRDLIIPARVYSSLRTKSPIESCSTWRLVSRRNQTKVLSILVRNNSDACIHDM